MGAKIGAVGVAIGVSDAASDSRLVGDRAIWDRKPVLRAIYRHYYERMSACTVPGRTLEIGGGSGNLKESLPGVISTDILPSAWLDARADAQDLPFRDRAFDNIVFVDVLHHLEDPRRFFGEARRVLRDGGRIVMVEPAMTPVSYPIYRFVHEEPAVMSVDPLATPRRGAERKDPYDSNQAIPCLLFGRYHAEFERQFPEFTLVTKRHMSLLAYPLSGGFQRWCLVPSWAVSTLLRIEDRVERLLGPLLGFRLFVSLSYRSEG